MNDVIYKTDSDEHLIAVGKKSESQWCELTDLEIKQDIMDSWDAYDRVKQKSLAK